MGSTRMLAVLAATLLFAPGCSGEPEQPPQEAQAVAFERLAEDPAVHGERVARVLGCVGCHGENLAGRDWSDPLGVLWTANLTQSAADYSDPELERMILSGRRPGRDLMGMPSHLFTQLHPRDMEAVLAFTRRIPLSGERHPEPTMAPELRKMFEEGKFKTSAQEVALHGNAWPPDAGEDHRLGRYLVRATCAECHGMDLRGGPPPFPGDPARPDLRLAAAYDPADFTRLMREGKAAGDRELTLMSEVARGRYAHFTDAEIEAVRAYLSQVARTDP
ncbi:MAG: c-type cytochrome [Qipengyuania sp.]